MNVLVLSPGGMGFLIVNFLSKISDKLFIVGLKKYKNHFKRVSKLKEISKNNIYVSFSDGWMSLFRNALQVIKHNKIDIIITHDPHAGLIGVMIYHIYKIPIIEFACQDFLDYIKVSNTNFMKKIIRLIIEWVGLNICYRKSHVIAISKYVFKKAKTYGAKRITLLPIHGIPSNYFFPKKVKNTWPTCNPKILTVARLSPEKGHKVLFDAFRRIIPLYPNACLLLIGDGPLNHQLKKYRDKLGLRKNIKFLGVIDQKQLNSYYNLADIFVLPSLKEGLGYVSGEALLCETPVIASNTGGIPDIIIDKKTGYLVKPGDARMLAKTLINVLKNPKKAKLLAKNGRHHVLSSFSYRKTMLRLKEILYSYLPSENREPKI